MWGGTDEHEALETIRTALEHGISLIDTAPVYGLGRAEELVGRALVQYGKREEDHHCNEGRIGVARGPGVSQLD